MHQPNAVLKQWNKKIPCIEFKRILLENLPGEILIITYSYKQNSKTIMTYSRHVLRRRRTRPNLPDDWMSEILSGGECPIQDADAESNDLSIIDIPNDVESCGDGDNTVKVIAPRRRRRDIVLPNTLASVVRTTRSGAVYGRY